MSSTGDGGNIFSTSSSKIYKGLGIILQGKVSPFFFLCYFNTLGPVVLKPISANHALNFNLGFIFFCSKAFSQIIFTILYSASIKIFITLRAKGIKLNLLFKLSNLNLNFALTLGYLNPALNNPALIIRQVQPQESNPRPRTLQPRGVLGISSDGDDQRIFLGLKFSIPGFFWVRKFGLGSLI